MNKLDSKLVLASILKREPALYVEHKRQISDGETYTLGKYYTFTENGLLHITFDIAVCLNMYNEKYIIRNVFNHKTKCSEVCLKTIKKPDTVIRNLSELLFGRWNAIKLYTLESRKVF